MVLFASTENTADLSGLFKTTRANPIWKYGLSVLTDEYILVETRGIYVSAVSSTHCISYKLTSVNLWSAAGLCLVCE